MVGPLGDEVALQEVRCQFADNAPVGAVFLGAHDRFQTEFSHQSLNDLLVDQGPAISDRERHASIAVELFLLVIDTLYLLFERSMLVRLLLAFDLVAEGAARQSDQPQKVR
ncbi:hypothetical protein D3C75_902510 [compost metagenome]